MAKANRRNSPAAGVGLTPEPVFLGTLRSEFDTEEELHPSWAALTAAAEGVRLAYIRHEITPEAAAAALSELRLEDRTGSEWTVGASTGEWYRRTGRRSQWLRTPPPTLAAPVESDQRWLTEGAAALLPSNAEPPTESRPAALPAELLPAEKQSQPFDDPEDFEAFLAAENAPVSTPQREPEGPKPRAGVLNAQELLGWTPSARSDGPELPEMAPLDPLAEIEKLEALEELEEDAEPVDLGYSHLVERFESELVGGTQEVDDLKPESATENDSFDDDEFDLPDDLFYRPDGK